jgi:hypothetical protein
MSAIGFNSNMDDINPDDSSSRRGVLSQRNDTEDGNISNPETSTGKISSRSARADQSDLIFVKDDKYESNVDYLETLMGVFPSYYYYELMKEKFSLGCKGKKK